MYEGAYFLYPLIPTTERFPGLIAAPERIARIETMFAIAYAEQRYWPLHYVGIGSGWRNLRKDKTTLPAFSHPRHAAQFLQQDEIMAFGLYLADDPQAPPIPVVSLKMAVAYGKEHGIAMSLSQLTQLAQTGQIATCQDICSKKTWLIPQVAVEKLAESIAQMADMDKTATLGSVVQAWKRADSAHTYSALSRRLGISRQRMHQIASASHVSTHIAARVLTVLSEEESSDQA